MKYIIRNVTEVMNWYFIYVYVWYVRGIQTFWKFEWLWRNGLTENATDFLVFEEKVSDQPYYTDQSRNDFRKPCKRERVNPLNRTHQDEKWVAIWTVPHENHLLIQWQTLWAGSGAWTNEL